MATDFERILSTRLHAEAAELVPGPNSSAEIVPKASDLVIPRRGHRWRAPMLVAAAVLLVAVVTSVVVHGRRVGGSAGPATAAQTLSPVVTAPAAGFECVGKPTVHSAQTGAGRIGVTQRAFCVDSAATALKQSGAVRALLWTEFVAAGAVEPTVDAVVWTPDHGSPLVVDLYELGELRGFTVALDSASAGRLQFYRGRHVVDQELVDASPPTAASSSPAESSEPLIPTSTPAAAVSASAGAWPTNARGQTYGSSADAGAARGTPDLILVVATNGKEGYALRTDLELPQPTSPSDAATRGTPAPRTIPVYKSDGVSQIGVFVVD